MDIGHPPTDLTVNGDTYTLVDLQREENSAIYTNGTSFMRIGKHAKIRVDLAFHMAMEERGFPVAKFITQGEHKGLSYFIEESLGEQHFGLMFAGDLTHHGVISAEHFEEFLALIERYAHAQISTIIADRDERELALGVHLQTLKDELPDYAVRIQERYNQATERLACYPFVLTHGDFNPHNLYPKGVIDLEDSFNGPIGYDLVSALVHIEYFPREDDYEFHAGYWFSENQKAIFLERIDAIAEQNGLPSFSQHVEDFDYLRAVWLASKLHRWPKAQQFRYELFKQRFFA